jgi:hypothetical protein
VEKEMSTPMQERHEPALEQHGGSAAFDEKKTFYVSVQAGSVLEDPKVASYELEIRATEEELNKLQELFEEYASADEAELIHFHKHPYGTAPVERMNAMSDHYIEEIYKLLYRLGTPETKNHIASMGLFPEGTLQ